MPSTSRADKYHIAELLGKGSFGTAHVVIDKETRKKYVLKRIRLARLNEWQRQSSFQEMELVSALSHPFVVPYVDGWVHGGHTINIVYGYCRKGDLGELLQGRKESFSEDQLKKWLAQILLAMEYMHKQGVIHRDIKSGNLFLTGDLNINIGDFGLATVRDSTNEPDYSVVGTPHYMSPELLSRKPYDFSTDIWSIGCVMYELTALKTAFNAFNIHGLVHKIRKTTVPPLPSCYSSEWCQLVRSMLRKSPDKRPSVMDLLNCPCMKSAIQEAMRTSRQINPNVVLPKPSPSVPLYWQKLSTPFGIREFGLPNSASKDRSRFGTPSANQSTTSTLLQSRTARPLIERPTQDAGEEAPSRIGADTIRRAFQRQPAEHRRTDENEGYLSSSREAGSDPKVESSPTDRSEGSEMEDRSDECKNVDPDYAATSRSYASDPGALQVYNPEQDTDRTFVEEPYTDRPKATEDSGLRHKARCMDPVNTQYADQYTDRSEHSRFKEEGLGVIPESGIAATGAHPSGSNPTSPPIPRPQSAKRLVFSTPRSDVSQSGTPREPITRADSARLSALICGSAQAESSKRWEVLEQAMALCADLHRRGRWEELGHILNHMTRGGGLSSSQQDPSNSSSSRGSEENCPFLLGDRVVIGSTKQCHGVIRYFGPVGFNNGDWVGLELDKADGKNNGTVNGIPYFTCQDQCGLFVRADMLKPEGR